MNEEISDLGTEPERLAHLVGPHVLVDNQLNDVICVLLKINIMSQRLTNQGNNIYNCKRLYGFCVYNCFRPLLLGLTY